MAPPDKESRLSIFRIHTKGKPLEDDVNLEELAEKTENCTGADISAICNEAVMSAVRRLVAGGKEPTEEEIANCKVSMDDMLKAVDKFGPAASAKIKEYGENSIYRH